MTVAEKIKAKENELRLIRRRETGFAVDRVGAIVLERESGTDFEIEFKVDREMIAQLQQGLLSLAEYQTEYLHRVWERVAHLLGMDYTRREEENDVSET